ncbi:two-component regulator propeller domain-containing protein [Vibrio sp. MA40-2]|uniref:ligand-binding sensor domain-containing protein n=1 Tax=Vibrio sp. MA40-2 TaxID=3391828 RepID=UPI0039A6EA43
MKIGQPIRRLLQAVLMSMCLLGTTAFSAPLSTYFVDTWTSNDGLPHNSINAISQTSDGYLWFATWEGVVRYNGLEFTLFDRRPDTHMLDSGTRALVSDADNRLWVGGARGSLVVRQGKLWSSYFKTPSLVNHILVDDEKNLWIAIEGMGVLFRPYISEGVYGPEEWKLQDRSVYRLTNNHNGIYAATDDGFYHFTADSVDRIDTVDFKRVLYISTANNGDILIGSNRGAWRWDGKSLHMIEPELADTMVTVVEQDSHNNYWLGTINQGIARVGHDKLEFLDVDNGLPNNRILSWFEDLEGNIWVGTNGGALRLRNSVFNSLTSEQGLIGDYVRTVLALNNQQLLVGSSTGLSLIEGDKIESALKTTRPLSVLSLAKSKQDNGVWVGTYQHGLLYWKDGMVDTVMDDTTDLPTNEVRAILEDSQANLWIGTPKGLVKKAANGNIYHFTEAKDGLSNDYIMALAEDELGHIWVGTGVGVGYWNDETFVQLDLDALEGAQYAFGFFVEPGYVWIATDRGVVRYRQSDQTVALIGRPQGLPLDKFFQVLLDEQENFWLSSNRGLWKMSYRQAHEIADGAVQWIQFEHFSENNGMSSSQANGGSNPAAVKMPDGRLYFATAKGVSSIQPQDLSNNKDHIIPLVLESVAFDMQAINSDKTNIVPAGTDRISFSYIGLSYVFPERLQYRTRLEGFDNEWVYRGNSTTADYTNLSPGEYRLFVNVRSPYGDWYQQPSLYKFTVEPMFWQRAEVIFVALFIVAVLIVSVVRWRINRLKKSEMELKEQVNLQTQELLLQSQKFEQMSNEDALTGLANRRAFDVNLQQIFDSAKANAQPLYLAILDIDNFKIINDHYSHLVGDKALVSIASVLNQYADDHQHVARWGGEEFTLLYLGNEPESFFNNVRVAIEHENYDHIESGLTITTSIGVAGGVTFESYEEMLKEADHALLEAKKCGRNCVQFRIN